MQANIPRRCLPAVLGFGLLASAANALAATGARVVVQAWNPLDPARSNDQVLIDHPTLVSDLLQLAWMQVRLNICEHLKLKMGLGGAAGGETLRDIDCLLDQRIEVGVTPAGYDALRVRLPVSGYVEATSTTPDIVFGVGADRALDPRISVALTAKLDLILAIQPDRKQTLRVSRALFTLDNATVDSQNFTGDMLKFVGEDLSPFFGGPNYKALAEDAINAVSADIAAQVNAQLTSVNQLLEGPSDLVRVGVSGAGGYISVAFAPREIEPPSNGTVTGLVRWDPARFTPRNGCRSFEVRAVVQTGPVPLYARDPRPPMRKIGVYEAEPAGEGACAFTLRRIAEGWPNVLTSQVLDPSVRTSGNSNYRETYTLSSDGWAGGRVVPLPSLDARNYRVHAHTLKVADTVEVDVADAAYLDKAYRTNPRFNPQEAYSRESADPGGVRAIQPRMADGLSPRGDAVRLNPQPLPPEPDPDPDPAPQAQARAAQVAEPIPQPTGASTSIIIVGGKPLLRRADSLPSKVVDPATRVEPQVQPPPQR